MQEKHQKAFPLIFDKCITVIPSTKPMQERESGQRDDNMGRDTPSRILDDERSIFAAQSMARWNDAASRFARNTLRDAKASLRGRETWAIRFSRFAIRSDGWRS